MKVLIALETEKMGGQLARSSLIASPQKKLANEERSGKLPEHNWYFQFFHWTLNGGWKEGGKRDE